MSDGRIVFVTFELYPLTAGGIGRAIFNMIQSVPARDRGRISVVIVGIFDHPPRIPFELSDLDVVFANVNDEHGLTDGEATYPPRWAYDTTEWHWRSFVAFRALRDINQRNRVDYVEFPDWGGLAYCTTQEKKSGLNFSDMQIAIRLHGPHGVLLCTERYSVTDNDLSIFDIERKSLRDCDLVIAQTQPYFEKVGEVFGFSESTWAGRCFYSPPPVLVDSSFETGQRLGTGRKHIVFTSKFQHIKRPEVFVRGVSAFLSSEEGRGWRGVFCAHVTDMESKRRVMLQIPERLAGSFEFRTDVSGAERDHLIAHSVVVVSSACESYCLAAFEAGLLGAIVVLNEANPSFGEGTLWHDGVNCLKYDGSASSLAKALRRAASGEVQLGVVEVPDFTPPWTALKRSSIKRKKRARSAGVSVIVYGADAAEPLSRTMRNIALSKHGNVELIVALAGDGSEDRGLLQEKIEAAANPRIRIVSNSDDRSLGASLNRAVLCSRNSHLLFVRAGDLLHSSFIERTSSVLNHEEIDLITSQVGYFDPVSPPDVDFAQAYIQYGVTSGEAWLTSSLENRNGSRPFAVKRSSLGSMPFHEELHDAILWHFWLRMNSENRRSMALNGTYAFCDITSPKEFSGVADRPEMVLNYHEILQATSHDGAWGGAKYLLMSHAARSLAYGGVQIGISDTGSGTSEHGQEANDGAVQDNSLDGLEIRPSKVSKVRMGRLLQFIRPRRDLHALRKSGLFDELWYLDRYPDVAGSGINPLKHYLIYGGFEGRYPNKSFDSARYLEANPDVAKVGMNPLVHYILHGRAEGRRLR